MKQADNIGATSETMIRGRMIQFTEATDSAVAATHAAREATLVIIVARALLRATLAENATA